MAFKGITWAGNIYQKFEAMCLEVEEAMYQDTVNYLENQVQTVGTSAKKFCSEVMQDFLPPCEIDPVKVAAADLPFNPYMHTEFIKKPKQRNKADIRKVKMKTDEYFEELADVNAERAIYHSPIFDGDSRLNGCSELKLRKRKNGILYRRPTIPMSSFREVKRETPLPAGEVCETREANGGRLMKEDFSISSTSLDSPKFEPNSSLEIAAQKQEDSTSVTTCPELSPEPIDNGTDAVLSECKEELVLSCEGRSYNCNMNAVSNDIEPRLEFVERLNESKFEETCVLVEQGCELHVVSPKEYKHKSYKKKIREAFSSKARSRKQEYVKLSAQYSIRAPNLERSMPEDSNRKKLVAQDIPESEWEIL